MKTHVEQLLADVIRDWWQTQNLAPAEMPSVSVSVPKDKAHGDFACAVVMAIAKKLGRNARALADELCPLVTQRLAGTGTCAVAGPGFLNVTLAADAGLRVFAQLLERGDQLGFSKHGAGKRVNVEYVSANPTGPLTVGHGRNAAIGDIVATMLAAIGYDVTREYYFNDAGNQMNVLARSVRTRYRQLLGSAEQLEENGYQGDYIIDIAKTVLQEHGDRLRDSDDLAIFKQYAVAATFAMIKATLARMACGMMSTSTSTRCTLTARSKRRWQKSPRAVCRTSRMVPCGFGPHSSAPRKTACWSSPPVSRPIVCPILPIIARSSRAATTG